MERVESLKEKEDDETEWEENKGEKNKNGK